MGFQTFSTIFLFLLITSYQRTLVFGRLDGEYEGPRDCEDAQTFRKRDSSFVNMLQEYTGQLTNYKMECGGYRTSHTTRRAGGYLTKEIKNRREAQDQPERCRFRIQAPEGHQVHIFTYNYKFIPWDYTCVNDDDKAILADWVKFYDGKDETNSLLYSSLNKPADFKVTSTGRDLLIDIDLSGRNVLSIKPIYQRFEFGYAFIRKHQGNVILYGQTKPLTI